jgi:hypothetical protein
MSTADPRDAGRSQNERGDKIVYSDEVHGNKVGRDKITVEDISGSVGIAIGCSARATMTQGPGAAKSPSCLPRFISISKLDPKTRTWTRKS